MAGKWKIVAVSEVAEPVLGGTPRRDTPEYWHGEIPWATAKDVAAVKGRYLLEVEESISTHGLRESAAKTMPAGTVVITARGTVGAIVQLGKDMAFNQTCYGLTPRKNVNQDYLFYALKASLSDIRAISYGTVFDTITMRSFDYLTIPLPDLPEQRAIAHILGTLDDKIELNRRMNKTLEAIARAIFKSWFVDFNPARAKAEGRDPGLPKHIADLFPDRFEDSELGPIPVGWRILSFAKTVEIIGGGTPKTDIPEYWNGEIPWFSVVDAPREADIWVVDTKKNITQTGVDNSSTSILPVGTSIISARGTVGKVVLVGVPMAMNQSCYGLRGKIGKNGYYNYFAVRQLVSGLQQCAHGSVFNTITRDTFEGLAVAVPPAPLVDTYEERLSATLERIRTNLFESRTLAALRDTLLPKLISGELRVPDAGRIIGSAL